MKAYLALFRLRFAVQLQYRAAVFAAFFTNLFFGFVIVMVYQAFYASSTAVQPLSLSQAITYTWLGQATFRMQPWNNDAEILSMIRSGNVAYELCRPLNLYSVWFCRLLAMRIVPALLTGIPIIVIALCLPPGFRMATPVSPAAGAAFFLSLTLALLLGCAISNLVIVSTLWTLLGDGMQRILPAVFLVFSGLNVPLAFFPDWAQTALRLMPFSGLVDTPFRYYLGTTPASQILPFALLQFFWIAIFVLLGSRLLASGMKRVVLQGG